MILNFKPLFAELVINGKKLHTNRLERHTWWKVGMDVHFPNYLSAGDRLKNQNELPML